MTRLNVNDARCVALFASGLQRTDAPAAGALAELIRHTVRRFGIAGCASRMAQEFGDHPEAAASRMRWIRQLISQEPAPAGSRPGRSGGCPAPRVPAGAPRGQQLAAPTAQPEPSGSLATRTAIAEISICQPWPPDSSAPGNTRWPVEPGAIWSDSQGAWHDPERHQARWPRPRR